MDKTIKHKFGLFPNEIFIETGTKYGEGVRAALDADCFKRVISIELSKYYYDYCKKRFGGNKKVSLFLGDTIDVLPRILDEIDQSCTFWIDAHPDGKHTEEGRVKIPILEELKIIGNHHVKNHTILVDDMRLVENVYSLLKVSDIEDAVYEINPDYKITYGFGNTENDILIAMI